MKVQTAVRVMAALKALSILAAKLARAVYFMLSRGKVFDPDKFYQD